MSVVNGATLLARSLARAGVGPIFTLSGNQILPVYDAGLDLSFRFIDGRHESAVAHMADAWGRLTGRPGVCLVTAGPGHTNALTGLVTARFSESPMLLLSGGSNLAQAGKGGFQELDQAGVAAPLCKAAWVAQTAEELPGLIARAWRTSLEGVPGPVHVTLPFDVLQARIDDATVTMPDEAAYAPTRVPADEAAVERAINLLSTARRPVLLGSPSVWRGVAGERLRAFLDLVKIPAFPVESPRGLTDPSLHGLGAQIRDADVVLMLCPQDFTIGFAGPAAVGDARLIQVASSTSEIGKNRRAEIGLVGDAASVLEQLTEAARQHVWPVLNWQSQLDLAHRRNLAQMAPFESRDDLPIHPLRLATIVRDALDDGASVALDGGEIGQWARWAIGTGRFATIGNGKLGGIGCGIPFAIAAKVARPAHRAVAFVGDGTFGFHGLELDTAVRFNLPIVVIVGNDAGWAAERHRQRELYGPDRVVATDLLPTRYDRVAEALGCHGEHVTRAEDLRWALDRAFASGKPACINVEIASIPSPSNVG